MLLILLPKPGRLHRASTLGPRLPLPWLLPASAGPARQRVPRGGVPDGAEACCQGHRHGSRRAGESACLGPWAQLRHTAALRPLPCCTRCASSRCLRCPLPCLLPPSRWQARSKEWLQSELGPKLGAQLWDYARGRDDRCAHVRAAGEHLPAAARSPHSLLVFCPPPSRRVEPPKPRKSVGAEVNYAVRFRSDEDAHKLLDDIGGWCNPLAMGWGARSCMSSLLRAVGAGCQKACLLDGFLFVLQPRTWRSACSRRA